MVYKVFASKFSGFWPWAFSLFFLLRLLLRCSEICSCWIRTLISTSCPSVRVGECIGCLRRSSPQRLCILGMSRREAFPSLGALVVVTTGSAKTCSISFFCEWVCETGWNFNVALVFIVILILLSFIRLTLSCLSGTNVILCRAWVIFKEIVVPILCLQMTVFFVYRWLLSYLCMSRLYSTFTCLPMF